MTLNWGVPRLVGRYCSYLLPKQDGGTSQIQVNKTQSTRTWDALYNTSISRVKFSWTTLYRAVTRHEAVLEEGGDGPGQRPLLGGQSPEKIIDLKPNL